MGRHAEPPPRGRRPGCASGDRGGRPNRSRQAALARRPPARASPLLGAVPHALGGLLHVLGGALRLALRAVALAAGLGPLVAGDLADGFLQRPRDLVHQPGHCLSPPVPNLGAQPTPESMASSSTSPL